MPLELHPLRLTPEILRQTGRIMLLLGRLDGARLIPVEPRYRKRIIASCTRSSTAIEGNTCVLKQVENIAEGRTVTASPAEQLEVRNALRAYTELLKFKPFSLPSLRTAHRVLMADGLILAPGEFRRQAVEVYITPETTRTMPPWQTVPESLETLFGYLKKNPDSLLFKSVRFHFEFVNIHPFLDGNGRTARLWQTRLLSEFHPAFAYADVETMIFEHRRGYYAAIRKAQTAREVNPFAEFMFARILEALEKLWQTLPSAADTPETRLEKTRTELSGCDFSRGDYHRLNKTISLVTAGRDLQLGVKQGLLTVSGKKRFTAYRFKK